MLGLWSCKSRYDGTLQVTAKHTKIIANVAEFKSALGCADRIIPLSYFIKSSGLTNPRFNICTITGAVSL